MDLIVRTGVLVLATFVAACSQSPRDIDGSSDARGDGSSADSVSADALHDSAHDASLDAISPTDVVVADSAPDVIGTDADLFDRSMCTVMPDAVGTTTRTASGSLGTMPYVAYVPATYDPHTPMTVVLALHGAGDTAANYLEILWQANADARGFIVIAPEGSCALGPGNTWCDNDPTMTSYVLNDASNCYTIDPGRRILNGFSAGGVLTYLIALENAQYFAGMAINSADLESAEATAGMSLLPSAWLIPLSQFHGTEDMNFPIAGARMGRDALIAAGHMVYWHEFDGGHEATAAFALQMYDDLASWRSPTDGM